MPTVVISTDAPFSTPPLVPVTPPRRWGRLLRALALSGVLALSGTLGLVRLCAADPAPPVATSPVAPAPAVAPGHLAFVEEGGVKRVGDAGAAYDFGTVSVLDRGPIEHTFTLRNAGPGPVTLVHVQTSCGCTSAVLGGASQPASEGDKAAPGNKATPGDKAPGAVDGPAAASPERPQTVAPGKDVQLRVSLDPSRLATGAVHKTVWVYSDGPVPPLTLDITGTLRPGAAFSPVALDFGRVKAGDTHPLRLTVTLDPRLAALGAPRLAASDSNIQIKPVEDKNQAVNDTGAVRVFEVSLAARPHLGVLDGTVSLVPASLPADPKGFDPRAFAGSDVAVTGEVTGNLTATPSTVAFGVVPAGQEATQKVVLAGPSLSADQVKASCGSPYLTAHIVPGAGGVVLQVALSGKMPPGSLETQVIVTGPGGEQLVLPALVVVTAAPRPAAKPTAAKTAAVGQAQ